jgi:hypothetical protein
MQSTVVMADAIQRRHASQVHQHFRLGQTEVHQRDQALAAGQRLGVWSEARQQIERLLDRGRVEVLERGRLHARRG